MITLTREEAQQVLEHLDDLVEAQQWEIDMHITQYGEEYRPHRVKHMRERLASTNGTIETLRARLSAPEPEPVAWMEKENYLDEDNLWETRTVLRDYDNGSGVPLYTAPPQREWQSLTDEEIGMLTVFDGLHHVEVPLLADYVRAIEAKLREKNND